MPRLRGYDRSRAFLVAVAVVALGGCGGATDPPRHEGRPVVRALPGTQVLVTAQAPGGKTFTISSERTRVVGGTHFGLRVVVGRAGGIVAGVAALRVAPHLAWEVSRICKPYPYGIIYGVLATLSDEVLVGRGAELQTLDRVAIPASVRPHSTLVYGILGAMPSRLIVRAPGAKVVLDEDIRSIFAETRCA